MHPYFLNETPNTEYTGYDYVKRKNVSYIKENCEYNAILQFLKIRRGENSHALFTEMGGSG